MIRSIPPIAAALTVAVFILLINAAISGAAPPPQRSDLELPTIRLNVDTVFLNLAVRDRATNRILKGLQKGDFLVYEDGVGQSVQQLMSSEAPFHLLILLDVSGSTGAYLKLMKKAAIEFTREIKSNDMVAVATFNWRVHLLQEFTHDRDAAARAISGIHSGGGTAFYDALLTCLKEQMKPIEGRKAIVVFTDGIDNQLIGDRGDGSIANYEQLRRKVEEDQSVIYTIFLDTRGMVPVTGTPLRIFPGHRTPQLGPSPFPSVITTRDAEDMEKKAYETASRQLEEIASITGGRMYSPTKPEDLSRAYAEIADDLRIQYLLGYTSSNEGKDDGWRSIKVEIKDKPQAAVRTRTGYYVSAHHEH